MKLKIAFAMIALTAFVVLPAFAAEAPRRYIGAGKGMESIVGLKDKHRVLTLKYIPSVVVKEALTTPLNKKVFIADVINESVKPEVVGENTEDSDRPITIYSKEASEAAAFAKAALVKELSNAGMAINTAQANADRVIKITLVKFWCQETETYKSVIRVKVSIQDQYGKELYAAIYTGSAQNFGRSLSAENYNQTFSDSVAGVAEEMLKDQALIKALK